MADTRILLLGNATSDALAQVLGRPGRVMTRVEDPPRQLATPGEHDVIVIDAVPAPRSLADVCREVRAASRLSPRCRSSRSAPATTSRSGSALLEAGADDVMIRPVDERELDARVEALDLRHRRSRELGPARSSRPPAARVAGSSSSTRPRAASARPP